VANVDADAAVVIAMAIVAKVADIAIDK